MHGNDGHFLLSAGLKSDIKISLSVKGLRFLRLGNISDDFQPYFHCACAETAIYELLLKIVTSSLDCPPDFLMRAKFRLFKDISDDSFVGKAESPPYFYFRFMLFFIFIYLKVCHTLCFTHW